MEKKINNNTISLTLLSDFNLCYLEMCTLLIAIINILKAIIINV